MNISRRDPIGAFRVSAILALSSLVMFGCSKKVEERTEAPNSQIVARVGNDVITTQELDNEFRLAHVGGEKRKDPALIKQVLGELVTRKYMVRQALDAKLDREPTVLLDLLRARDIVLAGAAASRDMATKSSAISQVDIDGYIAKNPQKFAKRQIATIEQITLPANAVSQALLDATKDMKSLDEVDQKLTATGINHGRSMGALNSADVSPEFFNLVEAKQTDNIFFLHSEPNAVFFKVNAVESHPLEGDDAIKMARHDLQIALLKSEASLTQVEANLATKYEGDYANVMGAQASGAPK